MPLRTSSRYLVSSLPPYGAQLDTKYRVAPQFGSNSILGIELGVVSRNKLCIVRTIRVRLTWTRTSRASLTPSLVLWCCGALMLLCCAVAVLCCAIVLCSVRALTLFPLLSCSLPLLHSDTNSSIRALCKGQKEKAPTIYRHTYICKWG